METRPARIVRDRVALAELAAIAAQQFGDMVKFDSMINVRPAQGNRSRDVEDERLRGAIRAVVARLVVDR